MKKIIILIVMLFTSFVLVSCNGVEIRLTDEEKDTPAEEKIVLSFEFINGETQEPFEGVELSPLSFNSVEEIKLPDLSSFEIPGYRSSGYWEYQGEDFSMIVDEDSLPFIIELGNEITLTANFYPVWSHTRDVIVISFGEVIEDGEEVSKELKLIKETNNLDGYSIDNLFNILGFEFTESIRGEEAYFDINGTKVIFHRQAFIDAVTNIVSFVSGLFSHEEVIEEPIDDEPTGEEPIDEEHTWEDDEEEGTSFLPLLIEKLFVMGFDPETGGLLLTSTPENLNSLIDELKSKLMELRLPINEYLSDLLSDYTIYVEEENGKTEVKVKDIAEDIFEDVFDYVLDKLDLLKEKIIESDYKLELRTTFSGASSNISLHLTFFSNDVTKFLNISYTNERLEFADVKEVDPSEYIELSELFGMILNGFINQTQDGIDDIIEYRDSIVENLLVQADGLYTNVLNYLAEAKEYWDENSEAIISNYSERAKILAESLNTLYENAKEFLDDNGEVLLESVMTRANELSTSLSNLLNDIEEQTIENIGQERFDEVVALAQSLSNDLMTLLNEAASKLDELFGEDVKAILAQASDAYSALQDKLNEILDAYNEDPEGFLQSLRIKLDELLDQFDLYRQDAEAYWGEHKEEVIENISERAKILADELAKAYENVKGLLSEDEATLLEELSEQASSLASKVQEIAEMVKNQTIEQIGEERFNEVEELFNNMYSNIGELVESAASKLDELFGEEFREILAKLGERFQELQERIYNLF